MGSILYLKEVPPIGGDTLFASMYAAYDALSESMRRFLCGLTAIHDGARNYEGRQPAAGRSAEFPRAEHPVVRTHPETGRPALFVNRMFTTRIVQLTKRESDAILGTLFRHIETPNSNVDFTGDLIRSRSGTIDVRSILPSGTIIRSAAMAIA